jgi:hypothetical protein
MGGTLRCWSLPGNKATAFRVIGRGKRHRARQGQISVLSGAPCGSQECASYLQLAETLTALLVLLRSSA